MKTYPNLFIVGAPKSGTTSLYHYLNQHPDICIPDKEPRFFIKDTIQNISDADPIKPYLLRSSVLNEEDYLNLYKNRTEKILCDSSTQYLYHYEEVIPKLKAIGNKKPKILILLRNPIDRAFSNYQHNLSNVEDLSFEQAIQEEANRISKGYNSFWYYLGLSAYANQVKAFQEQFDDVKIIFFEQFINDIDGSLVEIFEFLGIDSSFKPSNFLVNKKSTGVPKNKWLNNFFQQISAISFLKNTFYSIIGKEKTRLLKEIIVRKNLTKSKVLLTEETNNKLKTYFSKDVSMLKDLLPSANVNWLKDGDNS